MQKNFHSLAVVFLMFALSGCRSHAQDTNLFVYRTLGASLRQSNATIADEIQVLMMRFNADTTAPFTADAAKKWQPKALLIQANSDKLFEYLDGLKIDLKKGAGIKMVDGKEQWEEDNYKAVDDLFQKKGKGEEIKQRILEYEAKVLSIDPGMDSIFKTSVNRTILLTDALQREQKTFTETFFGNIPAVAAFAVLMKFENDIRNFELQLITYCYNQIAR